MSGHGATPQKKDRTLSKREVDAILNRVLDLESEGELHEAKRAAKAGAKASPDFTAALASTRRAIGELGEMPVCRDLTDSILDGVEAERPFLPRRSRRRVSGLRLAGAFGALATLTGYVLVQRFAPAPPTDTTEAPVSELVSAGRADVTATAAGISEAFRSLGSGLFDPVAGLSRSGPSGGSALLTLGGTGAYDVTTANRGEVLPSPAGVLTIVDVTPRGYSVMRYSPNLRPVALGEFAELEAALRLSVPASRLVPATRNDLPSASHAEELPPK